MKLSNQPIESYASKIFKNVQSQINLTHTNIGLTLGKFNILYFNINSIVNKLDEIELHIYELLKSHTNTVIHCIALTEVKLHENQVPYFNIPNYTAFFCTRSDGYGGTALYVHDSINAHLIEKKSTQNIELVMVKILELSATIAVVYKQPAVGDDVFLNFTHTLIESKKNIIVIGDMNLNLLIDSNTTKQYSDTLTSNGYCILNKVNGAFATRTATRIINNNTTSSHTLIDHVATDCLRFSYKLSQCDTPLSDHKAILLSVDNHNAANFISADVTNTFTRINTEAYNDDLSDFLDLDHFDTFDSLVHGIDAIKNRNSQIKTFTQKTNPKKPWITAGLLHLIANRKRYFLLRKKSPTNEYLNAKYAEVCERIKQNRHVEKTNFNSITINRHLNNPKQMWSKLNQIIFNKTNVKKSVPVLKLSNGEISLNRKEIANTLNRFYINIGKSLHDEIPISNLMNVNLNINNNHTMFLFDTSSGEVLLKIMKMKNSCSLKEFISANSIKNHSLKFAPILSKLINKHFNEGSFPNVLKCSRVVPLYKDGTPLSPSNYRPISILPVFSKVFESILCDRMNEFLKQHNIINKNQYGFQRNSGTLSAATTVVNLLQVSCDSVTGMIACCVFVDLRKAFDTVPHILLLEILHGYGFRGIVNSLIRDYLNNRDQYVDLSDITSESETNYNRFSVPQGSNLGPLLFLLYINGIFDLKLNGNLILFADDAVLIYFNTDVNVLKQKMQDDLIMIENWLLINKLTLNADKTKYMLIKSHGPPVIQNDFSLQMCNRLLNRVSSFKYLGITLQDNLKWGLHVDSLCRRIIGFSSVVNRLGNKLSPSTRISVYYSMVNSQLVYLLPVWNTSALSNDINRLQIAQNHALRKIFNQDYYQTNLSTEEIRSKYQILNVRQLCVQNGLVLMYKVVNNLMKTTYRVNYERDRHYQTRQTEQPRVDSFRTNTGKYSIFRSASMLFFGLDNSIRSLPSLCTFKKKIKADLLLQNE